MLRRREPTYRESLLKRHTTKTWLTAKLSERDEMRNKSAGWKIAKPNEIDEMKSNNAG